MSKELSIFCDESGDFGPQSKYYLLSLVFHDQDVSIKTPISHLERLLDNINYDKSVIHTYPLIRREEPYKNTVLTYRQKLFDGLVAFMKHSDIKIHSIVIEKFRFPNKKKLAEAIEKELSEFLFKIQNDLNKYEKLIVYYDKGQKQISRILFNQFTNYFVRVEFRIVNPKDYYIFQVADLACTLGLIKAKLPKLNKSELNFFGSIRRLKKNYLKIFNDKELL